MGNAIGGLPLLPLRPVAERLPADASAPSPPYPEAAEEADLPEDLPPLEEIPAPSRGACAVCFEEGSVLMLGCAHSYCRECLEGQLAARWPGPRVTFRYLQCALCRAPLAHDLIQASLQKHQELRGRVVAVAVEKFCEDTSPDERGEDVEARAEAEMAVYMCDDCGEPYCAGRAECAAAAAEAEGREQHRCHGCEWAALAARDDRRCMIHGHRFAMFKCDSCCAVATWNCYSNHYCERCHNQAGDAKHYPCPGPGLCPLGIPHPRNLEAVHGQGMVASFCLGCTACLGCEEAQEVDFGEQNQFGYPDRDWSSFRSGAELLAAIGEQEVRDRLGAQGSAADSAVDCADQLLAREGARQRRAEAAGLARLREEQAEEAAALLEVQESAAAAEQAAEEAAAAPIAQDPAALKAEREATRGADARRGRARRERLAAKLARVPRGVRLRQRGGRHKVPALGWPDDGAAADAEIPPRRAAERESEGQAW